MTPAVLSVAPGPEAQPGRAISRHPFALWFLPFWYVFLGFMWADAIGRQLRSQEGAAQLGDRAWIVVLLGLAGRIAAGLIEAGFYRIWWRSVRGVSIPFWALFNWIAALSALDLLAEGLVRQAHHAPALAAWIVPLTGVAALDPSPLAGGLGTAFSGLGLLVLARVVSTAAVQRALLRTSWMHPLAITFGAWGATRLLVWWSVDLMVGRSVLR
jgi:hypothetical protein